MTGVVINMLPLQYWRRLSVASAVLALTMIGAARARGATLSPSVESDAEYLLSTTDLMLAQFGMAVEGVEEGQDSLQVRTTGAEFLLDLDAGRMRWRQRLGRPREAGRVIFPDGTLNGLTVTRRGTGAVLLSGRDNALQVRINGDSLFMLKSTRALKLTYHVNFAPATVRQFRGNLLFLDEWGGMGSYVATGSAEPAVTWPDGESAGGPSVEYALTPGQILWLSVAPPRPYDWDASFRDRVVWHWSRQTGYPSDSQIEQWSRYGNVLLQQSEMMLWKDWALRFIPRHGVDEFKRVNRTCERFGMRNIVYTSPYYFLTGTGKESKAVNSFDTFAVTRFGPADSRGLNWPIFLAEITRVMRDYRPDGLYFDGIYSSVVRTYLLARKARAVVGDRGLLEYHATLSPPGGGVYLPQIDTYFNMILRGEGGQGAYRNEEYIRYFVSTYNISNAVGVLCNNNAFRLDEAFINDLLDANARLHLPPVWLGDYRKGVMQTVYWPALNDSLKSRVEAKSGARQTRLAGALSALRAATQADAAALKELDVRLPAGPDGVLAAAASMSSGSELDGGWQVFFSPQSEGAISTDGGVLRITARENTSAYVERGIPADTVAVVCRVRCMPHGGASWGPGLMLRADDCRRRINVRSDNRVGVDRAQGQLLFGGYRSGEWHWVRLRLIGEYFFYETSTDGADWRCLQMDRVGTVSGEWRLVIGKIANNGNCVDYAQTGGYGSCEMADLRVYAAADRDRVGPDK